MPFHESVAIRQEALKKVQEQEDALSTLAYALCLSTSDAIGLTLDWADTRDDYVVFHWSERHPVYNRPMVTVIKLNHCPSGDRWLEDSPPELWWLKSQGILTPDDFVNLNKAQNELELITNNFKAFAALKDVVDQLGVDKIKELLG